MTLALSFLPWNALAYDSGPPVDHARIRWPAVPPNDCTNCHDGFANSFPGSLELLLSPTALPLPAEYESARTYELLVRLLDLDPARAVWGFELAAITDVDFLQAGALVAAANPGVQVVFDPFSQVEFAMQRSSGRFQTDWVLEWTAPDASSGDVRLYVCANAGNGDGDPAGDHIFCRDYLVTAPPCPALPAPVSRLLGHKAGDDIVWSWQMDPMAGGGYRVYAVTDKAVVGSANASLPNALRDCPAPTATDVVCTELDGVVDPAAELYYQVVGACTSGEEGPN